MWLTGLWLLSVTLWPLGAAGAEGPTIRLFPTTVLEDIQQTGQVAKNLETGLQDVIARLRAHGAEPIGEITQYEDKYRLCYIRGPEGIIVALAEQLGQSVPAWAQVERRLTGSKRASEWDTHVHF